MALEVNKNATFFSDCFCDNCYDLLPRSRLTTCAKALHVDEDISSKHSVYIFQRLRSQRRHFANTLPDLTKADMIDADDPTNQFALF